MPESDQIASRSFETSVAATVLAFVGDQSVYSLATTSMSGCLREHLLGGGLLVLGGRHAGDAGEHRHAALAVELLDDPLGPQRGLELVGAGDGRDRAGVALEAPGAQHDRDLLRRRRGDLALDARAHRDDHHRVGILGGELLDVVDLLGRVAVGRRVEHLGLALLGVVLERLLVLERPRVRRALRRERDPVAPALGLLLELARVDVAELGARAARGRRGRAAPGPSPTTCRWPAWPASSRRSAAAAARATRSAPSPSYRPRPPARARRGPRPWMRDVMRTMRQLSYRLAVRPEGTRCWSQAASRIAAPSTASWPPTPAPELEHPDEQDGQQRDAGHGLADVAAAAGEGDAADDGRGHRVQVQAPRQLRVDVADVGRVDQPGEHGEQRRDEVGAGDHVAGADARHRRRPAVGAGGVERGARATCG